VGAVQHRADLEQVDVQQLAHAAALARLDRPVADAPGALLPVERDHLQGVAAFLDRGVQPDLRDQRSGLAGPWAAGAGPGRQPRIARQQFLDRHHAPDRDVPLVAEAHLRGPLAQRAGERASQDPVADLVDSARDCRDQRHRGAGRVDLHRAGVVAGAGRRARVERGGRLELQVRQVVQQR
jgi:hypothetical protein